MLVVGVDVGLKATGFVVCKVTKDRIVLLKQDEIITSTKDSLPKRLNFIFKKLAEVIKKYQPQIMVVEKLYSHYRHPTTLGILAQVRGVIILLSSFYKLTLYEYSPTEVKKAIVGRGNASAIQVKRMIENVFLKKKIKSNHVAGAFSLVVTFFHHDDREN